MDSMQKIKSDILDMTYGDFEGMIQRRMVNFHNFRNFSCLNIAVKKAEAEIEGDENLKGEVLICDYYYQGQIHERVFFVIPNQNSVFYVEKNDDKKYLSYLSYCLNELPSMKKYYHCPVLIDEERVDGSRG